MIELVAAAALIGTAYYFGSRRDEPWRPLEGDGFWSVGPCKGGSRGRRCAVVSPEGKVYRWLPASQAYKTARRLNTMADTVPPSSRSTLT